jgi:dTMP kinase
VFITFEGPEGAGKTTQARRLAATLSHEGRPVVEVREPGGTALGDAIRRLVLDAEPTRRIGARAEALLFCAARAQLVDDVIQPALRRGAVVVCDRFGDSTVAYQSAGRGLPRDGVEALIRFATDRLTPDVTFLLDLDPSRGLQRKASDRDRMEQEDLAYHQRVRDGYRALATAEPARFVVLDAEQSADALERVILARVRERLKS